jgi:pyruvate dehydrogenase E2 component (dihydrolipoamide acetyltransferase)
MAAFTFVLPEIGEGIEGGEVVHVLVTVGEPIIAEQAVLELETDKAVIEVPAPVSGTVQAIHVQASEKVAVGQRLLTLDTASVAAPPPVRETPPAPVSTATIQVAPVAHDDPEALVEPSPVTPPEPSRVPEVIAPAVAPLPAPGATAPPRLAAPAAPSVRLLAREIGVDINQVPGSGPGGRISQDDVKTYARTLRTSSVVSHTTDTLPASVLPDFTKWGAVQRQPMSNIRRITAERMAQAWATIPHVTQFDRADITALEALRQQYDKQRAQPAGGRLTITAILLKVLAVALKRFPQFNASLDMATHEVLYKQYYHIGVAVDTDRGLLVPVIHDVDQKNILTLALELTQLAERAKQRKTTLEEMQGGTFTVTNLGGLGGTNFTPIINAPEVAILGVARSRMEPVYDAETAQFTPRLLLPLALSYDHRLIDGADGVRFLRWVVEALQQPFLLALEG